MAHAAVEGMRRWVSRTEDQPYEELPADDNVADENKGEFGETGLASVDSSPPSTPRYTVDFAYDDKHTSLARLRFLFLGPLLLFQFAAASCAVLTRPMRRCAHAVWSAWPSVYERLGRLRVFVPSFLQPSTSSTTRPLHPSAWLDGLRGTAAFLVVWHHASLLWFSWRVYAGYGSSDKEHLFIQLPIVRLLISGPPQVAIFFVISGYAISYKPLRLSRMGRYSEASEAISSSIFRRHPRLFLMPIVVTFVAALMTRWNLYGTTGWSDVAAPVRRPPRPDTLSEQLYNWLTNVRYLTNPLSRDIQRGRPFAYDQNLWTLPVEFDCSLVVFLCQAAFNRLRPRVRLAITFVLACYAHTYIFWQGSLFLSGMFICDLHFHLDGTAMPGRNMANPSDAQVFLDPLAPLPPSRKPRGRRYMYNAASLFILVVALYVLSIPGKGGADTPGYRTLYTMVSELYNTRNESANFWIPPAAVLLVLIIDRSPFLQRPFTCAFPQYLGTISYSLYLVHGPLIWTAGHWLVRHTTAITGVDTDFHYGLGIALCALLLWPLLFYVADLTTRVVDTRAVNFGRWLYEKCVVRETEQTSPTSGS